MPGNSAAGVRSIYDMVEDWDVESVMPEEVESSTCVAAALQAQVLTNVVPTGLAAPYYCKIVHDERAS